MTETSAALLGADGSSRPVRLSDWAAAMPSGVYLSPSAGLEVGVTAREHGAVDPDRYAAEPKRWIDEGRTVCELGGTAVPVHIVFATVLRTVIARAQAECGWQLPAGLVLSYSPRWTPEQTQVLVSAAIEAGYAPDRLRLVLDTPEPVSGAVEFPPPVPAAVPHTPSSRLPLLVFGAVVLLIGSVITGVAVLRSAGGEASSGGAASNAQQFKTIAVGASQGVGYTVVDPVNHRLYTADTLDYTVSVVDTVTEKSIAKVKLDASPRSMAVDSQTRTLWVVGGKYQDGLGLLKIDGVSNTVVGTAVIPINTRQIAVHPTTHEVYTSQANGEIVDKATGAAVVSSAVDPVTLQISGRVVARGHGVDVAVNPDNGNVYLSRGGSVYAVDPVTKAVVGSIDSPVGGELLVVDPRTNTAFISSGSQIVVIDLAKGAYAGTIDIGHRAYWIAIDPVAGNVYAPESGANGSARLTVIDTATRTVKGIIDIGHSAEGIAADPLSHKVYVRPLASEVVVVEPCASMKCG